MDLQNEIVDRLIAAIDPEYIRLIGIEAIDKYNFIPLNTKNNCLFIGINTETDKEFITNYLRKYIQTGIEYVTIPNDIFSEVITYIINNKDKFENKGIDKKDSNDKDSTFGNLANNNIQFRKVLINVLQVCLIIFLAYKGYFPFNTGDNALRQVHYWVYDDLHLAFNVPNYHYKNKSYYCKSEYSDKILELKENINSYDFKINKIQTEIINHKNSKYNITDYDYQKIQSLYDSAHILNDRYYVNKAEREQKILKLKSDQNKLIDQIVEYNNQRIKHMKFLKDIEIEKMLRNYCVKLF